MKTPFNSPEHISMALIVYIRICFLGFNDLTKLGKALLSWEYDLSKREIEYLMLLIKGKEDKDISDEMNFAELQSVKNLGWQIRKKLGAANRTEAAVIAADYVFWEGWKRQK